MQTHARTLCFVLALFLCGCAGTNFNWRDAERVQPGMTEAEVVSILGRPYSRAQEGRVTVLTWSYADAFGGGRAVSFRLVDGKVAGSSTVNR